MQHIRKNWVDIGTMFWAIALIVVATTWVAAPAEARPGGGPDCGMACAVACEENEGCDGYYGSPGGCLAFCRDGESYSMPCI